jgi:hypothetical protein
MKEKSPEKKSRDCNLDFFEVTLQKDFAKFNSSFFSGFLNL